MSLLFAILLVAGTLCGFYLSARLIRRDSEWSFVVFLAFLNLALTILLWPEIRFGEPLPLGCLPFIGAVINFGLVAITLALVLRQLFRRKPAAAAAARKALPVLLSAATLAAPMFLPWSSALGGLMDWIGFGLGLVCMIAFVRLLVAAMPAPAVFALAFCVVGLSTALAAAGGLLELLASMNPGLPNEAQRIGQAVLRIDTMAVGLQLLSLWLYLVLRQQDPRPQPASVG